MHDALALCSACHRHVRAAEGACPFCGIARVALLAGALLAAVPAHADPPRNPRLDMQHAPAQAYGAPPFDPMRELEAPPVVLPHVTPVRAVGPEVVGPVVGDEAAVRAAVARRREGLAACARSNPPGASSEVTVLVGGGRVVVRPASRHLARYAVCVRSRLVADLARVTTPTRFRLRPDAGAPTTSRCGASPAGCRRAGCPSGFVCARGDRCLPTSCGCNPETGEWTCTDDCGGGECVPVARRVDPLRGL